MNRTLLPRRPLSLRTSYYARQLQTIAIVLTIALLFFALAAWLGSRVIEIRADQALWQRGQAAVDVSIEGTKRSKPGLSWFVASYDIEVTYVDVDGNRYRGEQGFWTMFGVPDTDKALALRYDPNAPQRFTLEWAVDASGPRWRFAVVTVLLAVGFALLILSVAWDIWRRTLATRRCAREGVEVVGRLVSAVAECDRKGRPTRRMLYAVQVEDGANGRLRTLNETADSERGEPLHADPSRQTVTVLQVAGQSAYSIVLFADLYPLKLTEAERSAANRQALAASDAEALEQSYSGDRLH